MRILRVMTGETPRHFLDRSFRLFLEAQPDYWFPPLTISYKGSGVGVKAAQDRRIRRLGAQFSSSDGRQGDSDAFVNQSRIGPGGPIDFDSNCPSGKG
jgi:hypothetical protein